jgi:hypothetical protein
MFSQGIRWSGLIVKLCGCDVQALQMSLCIDFMLLYQISERLTRMGIPESARV